MTERDALINNLRSLAASSAMPATLELAAKEIERLRFQRDLLALNSWGFKNGIFIVHGNDGSVVDVVLNEDRTGSSDLITMPVQAEAAEAAKEGE